MKLKNGGIVVDIPEREAEPFLRAGYVKVGAEGNRPQYSHTNENVDRPNDNAEKRVGGVFEKQGGINE